MPANGMYPLRKSTVACLTVLVVAVVGVQGLYAQDGLERAAPLQLTADRGSLRIEGDAAALHVVVQQTAIADVLAALKTFNIRYRSSIGLDERLDGSYAGSLGQVVGRLLNGYNYATKRDGSRLEVTIFGKGSEVEVPAPVISVRRRSSD
jgi:hypothetical protein